MSATALDTEFEPEQEVNQTQRTKPKAGKLANKLIGMMEQENIRNERESYQLPSLGPLGDKSIWNFEVFPKVKKTWKEMNKKD